MRHGELLAAVSDLDPGEVKGDFERHCGLRWEDLTPSAAGGRWGTRRAFEVLYLGRPRESVVVEAYRHLVDDELDMPGKLAAAVIERRVLTCEVRVDNILDLRSPDARTTVDITDNDLFSEPGEYERCQAIGAAAHQLGRYGVIAPSASRLGETLALFSTNLPVEQWPTVKTRDIWRGLPSIPADCALSRTSPDPFGEPSHDPRPSRATAAQLRGCCWCITSAHVGRSGMTSIRPAGLTGRPR